MCALSCTNLAPYSSRKSSDAEMRLAAFDVSCLGSVVVLMRSMIKSIWKAGE